MPYATQDLTLLIAELVTSLAKHASQQDILAKRRTDARYRVEMPLPVRVGPRRPNERFLPEFKVWAMNISNTGMGLLTDRNLALNSHLQISLSPFGLFDNVIPARVVFSRNLVGDMHRVGVVFLLDDDDPRPARR